MQLSFPQPELSPEEMKGVVGGVDDRPQGAAVGTGSVPSFTPSFLKGILESNPQSEDDIDYSKSLIEELEIHPLEILRKIRCLLFPFNIDSSTFALSTHQSDFWGPFSAVLLYSFLLLWGQFRVLGWVILIWLLGSYGVFFLARCTGGSSSITYSQVVQILGYSCVCLSCAVLLIGLSNLTLTGSVFCESGSCQFFGWMIRLAGTAWASTGAARVLCAGMDGARWVMLAYPIAMVFLFLLLLY